MASSKSGPRRFKSIGTTYTLRPTAAKNKSLLVEAQKQLRAGNLSGAIALAHQAMRVVDNADTRLILAMAFVTLGDLNAAEENFTAVLRHQPKHRPALLGLGQLKLNSGKADEAIAILEHLVKLDPTNLDAKHLLARSYGMGNRLGDAARLFAELITTSLDNADVWSGYGRTLAKSGSVQEAIAAYKKALELKPMDDAIHQGLGAAYLSIGQIDDAMPHFKNATALKPERGIPFRSLAKHKDLTPEELQVAKTQLSSLPPHDPRRRTFLAAIAAVAERSKKYDEAFSAVSEMMAISAAQMRIKYEPKLIDDVTDQAVNLIGATPRYHWPIMPVKPLFIIGMPRSGSTLVEQIFARHPDVLPAGEHLAMNHVLEAMNKLGKPYPNALQQVNTDEATALRRVYFTHIRDNLDNRSILTDKFLGNVFHLPLIETIFPEALVLHCRRHPMDILWSIITQGFASNVPFAHNIEHICHHMLRQHQIFSVWRERGSLPTLEVFYEQCVEQFESTARKLVEFSGLPWDDACLTPHESQRAVLTASAGQVHQPVYRASVGRWKPFAAHLGTAVESLKSIITLHEAELTKRGIG